MSNIRYNKAMEKQILSRLCEGESIRSITRDPGIVSWSTFSQKLKDNEKLQDQYYNCKRLVLRLLLQKLKTN